MIRQTENNRQRSATSMHLAYRCKLVVLFIGCLAIGGLVFGHAFGFGSKASGELPVNLPHPVTPVSFESFSADSIEPLPVEFEPQTGSFTRFQHTLPQHNRMPCLLCHKRENNSPTPKLPGHSPCIGCHTEQFANSGSNICKICHTNPQTGAVKRFPRIQSFNARFDHAKHQRATNCATCHKPTRGGVALSIPASFNAHTSCFQCHSSNASENMASCGTCHQPGRLTRTSESARAFAVNFSHAEHARNLNCNACHTIRAGAARGRQVSAPQASMHFAPPRVQSCATCHNNRRAFGGDDFSDCKRCHTGNNFRFGGR